MKKPVEYQRVTVSFTVRKADAQRAIRGYPGVHSLKQLVETGISCGNGMNALEVEDLLVKVTK